MLIQGGKSLLAGVLSPSLEFLISYYFYYYYYIYYYYYYYYYLVLFIYYFAYFSHFYGFGFLSSFVIILSLTSGTVCLRTLRIFRFYSTKTRE